MYIKKLGRNYVLIFYLAVVTLMAYMLVAPLLGFGVYEYIYTERMLIEILQASFLFIAAVIFYKNGRLGKHIGWNYFFSLLCIILFLEEVNYGQVLFHFKTPMWVLSNGYGPEFNMHQMYFFKGTFLKELLYIIFQVYFIVLGLVKAFGPKLVVRFRNLMIAPLSCAVLIFMGICINIITEIYGLSDYFIEMKELIWAIVFLVYALSGNKRLWTVVTNSIKIVK